MRRSQDWHPGLLLGLVAVLLLGALLIGSGLARKGGDHADGSPIQIGSGSSASVASLALSPDGKTVITAGMAGVQMWSVADHRHLRTVDGTWSDAVAWSPDGRWLATASAGLPRTIRLWRVADGAPLDTLTGPTRAIVQLAWSADGATLAAVSDGKTVRLWRVDAGRGESLRTLATTDYLRCVAVSPDGRLVAAGGDRAIRVWQVGDGRLVRTLATPTQVTASIAFSPDGQVLAAGGGIGTLWLWRVSDGVLVRTIAGHSDKAIHEALSAVAFSPDGRFLATGSGSTPSGTPARDTTVRLWRVRDGTLVKTFTGHSRPVTSIAWSPDGRTVVSGGADGTIRFWPAP
ncbi:MAG TPA: WD40 repeat domain-containing protein [Thermomicrobiales bacterium]|nr:WD40 repeat domain-containing protein [Thermomicrobiales bacterium]